jgi:hypothetical protein
MVGFLFAGVGGIGGGGARIVNGGYRSSYTESAYRIRWSPEGRGLSGHLLLLTETFDR